MAHNSSKQRSLVRRAFRWIPASVAVALMSGGLFSLYYFPQIPEMLAFFLSAVIIWGSIGVGYLIAYRLGILPNSPPKDRNQ